ncbi:MAG: hypothetical protein ACSHXI_19090 [Hoeflea sp.]|uniref:hypothetical protein n=1 Tax=Hoeflea sp. TaxID=1940281 RepID=UPI003EF87CCF
MNLSQTHRSFFDLDFVRRSYPQTVGLTDAELIESLLDRHNSHPFNPNCIFDVNWYAQKCTETEVSEVPNPIIRYLTKGAGEDAWPNPFFDPLFFRRNVGVAAREYPTLVELALANLDGGLAAFHPFIDVAFICEARGHPANFQFYVDLFSGTLDIRRSHPLFDVDYVRDQGGADVTNLREAFAWYWESGGDLATHELFDVEFYQDQLKASGSVVYSVYHYLISSQPLSPQPLLDTAFYLAGVDAAGAQPVSRPLEHFIVKGQAMDIAPSPYFDVKYYRDQACCGQDALQHYVGGGHERFSPHPFINALEGRLLARASQHRVQSLAARLAQRPDGVPMSLTPDLDPVFLAKISKDQVQDLSDLRKRYFHHGYPGGQRPNALITEPFVVARLSALGEVEDVTLQTYFSKALHQCKRLLVALENLDDTEPNRVWLDILRSQIANPEVEFVVVGARGGSLLSEFASAAHLWVLSGLSTEIAPLDTLRRSSKRLAEVIASNPPVAAFVEVEGGILLPEAMAVLKCPTIVFGGAGLARRSAEEVHRMAAFTDHILCASALVKSKLQGYFKPGEGPATTVFGASLESLRSEAGSRKNPADTRRALGLPEDAIIVVGSGPLDIENSVDLFGVVAAKCLSNVGLAADVYFVWHGGRVKDPNTPQFYASYFVQASAASDRIRIISNPDLEDVLADADIYLKFCRNSADISGVTAAKAAGLPVVLSRGHPDGERIAESNGVILVDAFDLNSVCDTLLHLFTAGEERQRLGADGQRSVQTAPGIPKFIERINTVLVDIESSLQLRADLALVPKKTALIVASGKMSAALVGGQGRQDSHQGQAIKRLDPAKITFATVSPRLQDLISGFGCDEIVVCSGSEGLSRDFVSGFSHAVWVAEGLISELTELYRLGLGFEEIFVRNEKLIAEMSHLNPKIAALMSTLDETPT